MEMLGVPAGGGRGGSGQSGARPGITAPTPRVEHSDLQRRGWAEDSSVQTGRGQRERGETGVRVRVSASRCC